MRMNNHTQGETVVTWRDVVKGTPWLKERKEFSAAQAAFCLQPSPAEPNELERETEAWRQVELLRKKCAAKASTATSSAVPPDAPPNTPASSADISTVPEPINHPAIACSRLPPGIHLPPSNQFVPDSNWTQLSNPRDNPAPAVENRTPFDELDLELGRSSLVETPLSQLETEEAVDDLLKQCPDLSGGPTADVEMMELNFAQTSDPTRLLNASLVRFQPEISNTSEYNYNLIDQESGMSTAPGSPVTAEDDELLDMVSMVASPVPDYSWAVGTGCPKSTTPKKKQFRGPEDPK